MTKQQQIALKEATISHDLFTPPLLALLSVVTLFEVVNTSFDVVVVHIGPTVTSLMIFVVMTSSAAVKNTSPGNSRPCSVDGL